MFKQPPLAARNRHPVEPTPYEVLGLPETANFTEIARQYRALVLQHHPDKAGPASTDRFLQIYAAYQNLRERFPARSTAPSTHRCKNTP